MRWIPSPPLTVARRQAGWTLIEMLVVVSVIGILAAVVALSLIGVTHLADQRAADAELRTVQSAMDAMTTEQRVAADQACSRFNGRPTSNMGAFPAPAQDAAPLGAEAPRGRPVPLYPAYLRQQQTRWAYRCTATGQVTQIR